MQLSVTQKALQERYPHLHPILFLRSVEKAETDGELFDILEGFPGYPVIWDETKRRWVQTNIFHSVFNSEE